MNLARFRGRGVPGVAWRARAMPAGPVCVQFQVLRHRFTFCPSKQALVTPCPMHKKGETAKKQYLVFRLFPRIVRRHRRARARGPEGMRAGGLLSIGRLHEGVMRRRTVRRRHKAVSGGGLPLARGRRGPSACGHCQSGLGVIGRWPGSEVVSRIQSSDQCRSRPRSEPRILHK